MRIENVLRRASGSVQELSATVVWEDSDRAPQEIFFRVCGDTATLRDDNFHPFLVGAIAPALRNGEKRIKIDGPVCPVLKEHLRTLVAYLNEWYWYEYGLRRGEQRQVALEAGDSGGVATNSTARTGCFFSGGVDSFCMIRQNRSLFPRSHPFSIRDAFFVHGFDMGGRPEYGTEEDAFRFMADEFRDVMQEAALNLLAVYTNVRTLEPSFLAWRSDFMGPAMAALAHVFSGHLSDICIASSQHVVEWQELYASHPFTTPYLGSHELRFHYTDARLRRVDKVAVVAEWPAALRVLRVCLFGTPGKLNCGRCEKCTRTALELLCAGKSAEAAALSDGDLTPELVRQRLEPKSDNLPFYVPLAGELERKGFGALARAVKQVLRRRHLRTVMNVADGVRRADKNLFAGNLRDAYHALTSGRT